MRDYIYISKDNSHLNHDLNLHFSFSQSGSFDAVSVVHSYEHEKSVGHQKTKLSALNVIHYYLLLSFSYVLIFSFFGFIIKN
jgi:hypothetical protein